MKNERKQAKQNDKKLIGENKLKYLNGIIE